MNSFWHTVTSHLSSSPAEDEDRGEVRCPCSGVPSLLARLSPFQLSASIRGIRSVFEGSLIHLNRLEGSVYNKNIAAWETVLVDEAL